MNRTALTAAIHSQPHSSTKYFTPPAEAGTNDIYRPQTAGRLDEPWNVERCRGSNLIPPGCESGTLTTTLSCPHFTICKVERFAGSLEFVPYDKHNDFSQLLLTTRLRVQAFLVSNADKSLSLHIVFALASRPW